MAALILTPIEIPYSSYRTDLLRLREEAWVQSDAALAQRVFTKSYEDAHDEAAYHWAIFDGPNLIAAARLTIHTDLSDIPDYQYRLTIPRIATPIGAFNRLVVDPLYQGAGLSSLLDKIRFDKAKALACQSVVGTACGFRSQKLIEMGFAPICEMPALAPPVHYLHVFDFSI